jgi:hypothetical protein
MLGPTIEALCQLAGDKPNLFKKPAGFAKAAERLKPFLQLRSTLAHSTIRAIGKGHYIFDHAAADPLHCWSGRIVLHENEFEGILRKAAEAVNGFRQQVEPPSIAKSEARSPP